MASGFTVESSDAEPTNPFHLGLAVGLAPCPGFRWPTCHVARAAVVEAPARILGSRTAVDMTASSGWK